MKNSEIKLIIWSVLFYLLFLPSASFAQKIPKSNKLKTEPEYTIDIYEAFKNAKDYQLSTVAESIEYIPLETNLKCLLANVANITVTATDILIFVYEDKCYRFNRQGKFMNAIGSIGRGPKEFTKARSCSVDTINNWIYIVDWEKLVKYDFNGNFIDKYSPNNKESLGFYVVQSEPGLFLFGNSTYQYANPGERFPLYFYSEQQNKYLAKVACEKKDKIPFSICLSSLYTHNNHTFLSDYWSDIIYKVNSPHELKPYAVLDKGKFKYQSTDDKSIMGGKNNNSAGILEVLRMAENDRYIFIATNKGTCFYDKKTKQSHFANYNKSELGWANFNNDISSVPFRLLINAPHAINNNQLYSYNNALDFFSEEVDANNTQVQQLLKNLQPDDNPVLVLVKLKK